MTPPDLTRLRSSPLARFDRSRSALLLVAANLVPLAGVLFFGWSVFATLLLYWVENVIVGAFTVLRMAWAQPANPAIWLTKLWLIPFFVFHYGIFTIVHGVFVVALFGGGLVAELPSPAAFIHAVRGAGIWPAAVALVVSHGVWFAFSYLGAGEYRTAQLKEVLWRPYDRVMVLHAEVLGGGYLVQALGSPRVALALLVILKTRLDLVGHLRELRLRPSPRAQVTKIRIIACPPGGAPQHVRDAWIGLELPTSRRRFFLTSGALSGPGTWSQRLLALVFGGLRLELGYAVNALAAVDILATKNPAAATWWRAHRADVLDGKRMFVFAAQVCEECR